MDASSLIKLFSESLDMDSVLFADIFSCRCRQTYTLSHVSNAPLLAMLDNPLVMFSNFMKSEILR